MLTPSGCQHCGVERHDHFQRWTTKAGWHKWTAPTQEQIKERMQARRAARLAPKAVPVVDETLIVTLTVDAAPAMRALQGVQAAVMFGWHPDLQEPTT